MYIYIQYIGKMIMNIHIYCIYTYILTDEKTETHKQTNHTLILLLIVLFIFRFTKARIGSRVFIRT